METVLDRLKKWMKIPSETEIKKIHIVVVYSTDFIIRDQFIIEIGKNKIHFQSSYPYNGRKIERFSIMAFDLDNNIHQGFNLDPEIKKFDKKLFEYFVSCFKEGDQKEIDFDHVLV